MAAADIPSSKCLYHGTKAVLKPGDLIEPGHPQNRAQSDETTAFIYMTSTLDAAAWQGELAPGDGPGRIYAVTPAGTMEADPDPAETKYPGIATESYRSRAPLRVKGECTDSEGRPLRLYHGTKADLIPGDLIEAGRSPNVGSREQTTSYVYLSGTLNAAIWGAELALGDGAGRIYVVEPTGPLEDDPNLTNQRFPGNPTKSYRSRQPLRVTGEVLEWQGHAPEALKAMKDSLEDLERRGVERDDH
jgi:rifampin ADP-ribosylating transferase